MQILDLKSDRADEAIRLVRELWEMLRRKQGCVTHRLYHSVADTNRFVAYSEWQSLAELGGARKELARSPLYRRLHAMLEASSERAYEPSGATRTIRGANLGPDCAAMLIRSEGIDEKAEQEIESVKDAEGYLTHIVMGEVGESKRLAVIAHFTSQANAEAAAKKAADNKELKDLGTICEVFKT